jgi:hypothetical protein
MTETNWLQVAAALVGGGAVGAVITALVTAYRMRQQPVGRRVDVLPVFRPSRGPGQLEAAIAISHGGKAVTFKNLFLAEVQVVNRGNRDLEEFSFGATLGNGDQCIYVEAAAPDRHHQVLQDTPVAPDAPRREIDFRVKPFNRGNVYSFKLYVVIPAGEREPKEVVLGSPNPIRFVAMPTAGEMLARAASEFAIDIAGVRIGLRR